MEKANKGALFDRRIVLEERRQLSMPFFGHRGGKLLATRNAKKEEPHPQGRDFNGGHSNGTDL